MFAVFLDRDGVINVDTDYLCQIQQLVFAPRAIDALIRLSEELPPELCKIIVVTNQSGVARGLFTEAQCVQFGRDFVEAVTHESRGKARIDDYLYCPHHPAEGAPPYLADCDCRKPKPGLLTRAQSTHDIDLLQSFLVGDQNRDILAGKAASCFTIFIRSYHSNANAHDGDKPTYPDASCINLYDAVEIIIQELSNRGGT